MSTREYANPPVHEVVVSLAFDVGAGRAEVFASRAGSAQWPEHLARRVDLDDTRIRGRASPIGGEPTWQARVMRTGLALSDRPGLEATRALQLRPELASYHAVRPSPWPRGRYAGWDAIAGELSGLRPQLASLYEERPIVRLALRYLNRLAIPDDGSAIDEWLAVGAYGPPGVNSPNTFSLRFEWASLDGAPEFGAALGLQAIDIEDPELSAGNLGVLLDVEVARPNDRGPVAWEDLDAALDRAHTAHGALFEACVTPALRAKFQGPASHDPSHNGGT